MTSTTTAQAILTHRDGAIMVVTMNRPERLNALNTDLIAQLRDALRAAAEDESVHATVLTGAGRAFTSGADLTLMQQVGTRSADHPDRTSGRNTFDDLEEVFEEFPKPLIAAANGLGVGFGFTVLGYCDHVFVAEGARFRTPFSQLGLCPEASASYTFPLRMGWAQASRALLLGEWFTAQEVVDSGLAQQVVPKDRLMDVTMEFARKFEQCPLQSLMATKRLMTQAHLPHVRSIRAEENLTMKNLIGTEANKQAVSAFFARESKARK